MTKIEKKILFSASLILIIWQGYVSWKFSQDAEEGVNNVGILFASLVIALTGYLLENNN